MLSSILIDCIGAHALFPDVQGSLLDGWIACSGLINDVNVIEDDAAGDGFQYKDMDTRFSETSVRTMDTIDRTTIRHHVSTMFRNPHRYKYFSRWSYVYLGNFVSIILLRAALVWFLLWVQVYVFHPQSPRPLFTKTFPGTIIRSMALYPYPEKHTEDRVDDVTSSSRHDSGGKLLLSVWLLAMTFLGENGKLPN